MLQSSRTANLTLRNFLFPLLKLRDVTVCALLTFSLAAALGGCGAMGPKGASAQIGVVSQDAHSWSILYSEGTPAHPAAPPASWAVSLPSAGGHLNYVQVPYRAAARPQQIVLTFQVLESSDAIPVSYDAKGSPCRDHDPCTPVAEFHVFFEQQGDDLTSECGRWWYKPGFRLTDARDDSYDVQPFVGDGQPHTITIPLTAEMWTSVNGLGTAAGFEAALMNVGYVGITFGGSDYFGHGVDVEEGTVQFQMIDFQVE